MKKYLIPTAAVVVAAALGTPYYLGVKAEESLTEQQKLLQESGFLTVESHQYDRGWFSSTETTVIRLKPTPASKYAKIPAGQFENRPARADYGHQPRDTRPVCRRLRYACPRGNRVPIPSGNQKSFRPLLRPANAVDHDQYGLPFRRRQTQPQYSRLRL